VKLRKLALLVVCLSLFGSLAACGGTTSLAAANDNGSNQMTIGTANFTENVILGYLYQGALEAKGIDATVKPNLGSREVIVPALEHGDLDLIPEYQGSLLLYLDQKAKQSSASDVQQALKEKLPKGLEVLPYAAAQDADVFVVTKETAQRDHLSSLADLAKHNDQYVFGGPA
jgi:osmoprotectant transport system substrate-binding protein